LGLPVEILKKVKALEISTRKLVNNLFSGEYQSAFRGQGMTFSEFREYIPGDDVRLISWPLTARTGKPFIKKFDEERELTLMLIVDVSGSGAFGSKGQLKSDVMAHVGAILSFSAIKNSDPVGLVMVSDHVEHYVLPKKGRSHVFRILRDLYYFKPKSKKTSLAPAFEFVSGVLKKKATVFVLSDFMDQDYERALRMLGRKHDVVACVVKDPMEENLPSLGLVEFEDAESGEVVVVDTSSGAFQTQYTANIKNKNAIRDTLLKKAQVDRIDFELGKDIVDPLIHFFRKRNGR
jgi:uncharacterized protein (DUF58 family)